VGIEANDGRRTCAELARRQEHATSRFKSCHCQPFKTMNIEWKTIDSAPRDTFQFFDGRGLLLYSPYSGMVKGYWSTLFSDWVYCDETGKKTFQPTHWMPLPEPPKP